MLARMTAAVVAFVAGSALAQTPGAIDATHCYAGTSTGLDRRGAYNITLLDFRGTVQAAEPGKPLDRHITHCVASGGTVGNGPNRVSGFCEWSASGDDHLLSRWTFENGRANGEFVGGTGRYKGATGQYSLQAIGPFPQEAGVLRGCNRLTGEVRLP